MPRVAFYTLGCKVNQGETAEMAHLFRQAGYELVDFSEPADVYIVNTCAVTVQAEKKSRQVLRRAREHSAEALLVMVGCYPQVAGKEDLAAMTDIDLIVGSSDKHRIVSLVEQALEVHAPVVAVSPWAGQTDFAIIGVGQDTGRTRATLKVQDGCQQFCSYCIIPYARGPERSRAPEAVLDEARTLLTAGFQEIVLTGIHLGSYGRDLEPRIDLVTLVRALLPLPGLRRLRLSSIEPNEINAELLTLMRDHENFCRHLHIPLQAGEDRVLRAMNRRYSTDDYRRIVALARSYVPEIAVTTDVIVGFPGETEAEFLSTCQFVREIGFSRLHVFRYSVRPGTPAATLPEQIPAAEKERRSRQLISIGHELSQDYARRALGRVVPVLWEHQQDGLWIGHTDTYLQVYAENQSDLGNRILKAKMVCLQGDRVYAVVAPE